MDCLSCSDLVCNIPAENYVRLGRVEGKPTYIGLFSSWGDSDMDIKDIIPLGETNTKMELNKIDRTIDYYQELWISSGGFKGCINEICLVDVFSLMKLTEMGDVNAYNPSTGETIVYNENTDEWETYDLVGNITNLQTQINNLNTKLDNHIEVFNQFQSAIQNQITEINNRISDIENLIVDYSTDKTTKIARGNINIYSGDWNGSKLIRGHSGNSTNNDLRFS